MSAAPRTSRRASARLLTAATLLFAPAPAPALAETRPPVWRVAVGQGPLAGPVEVGESALLVADSRGEVVAIDAASGQTLSRAQVGDPVVLLIPDPGTGGAVALTAAGSLAHLLPDGRPDGEPRCLPAPPLRHLVSASGRLLVPLADGSLLALAADTRVALWRAPDLGRASAAPAASESRVAVATEVPEIAILDAATGAVLARVPLPAPLEVAPAWAGERLLAGLPGERLLGLDGRSGRVRFRAEVGRGPSADLAGRGNRAIIATLSNLLVLLKDDGNPEWTAPLPGRVRLPPVVRGTRILVVPHRSGTLAAFERTSGAPAFQLELPDPLETFTSVPAVVLGQHVLATSQGSVVSLGGPGTAPLPAPLRAPRGGLR